MQKKIVIIVKIIGKIIFPCVIIGKIIGKIIGNNSVIMCYNVI